MTPRTRKLLIPLMFGILAIAGAIFGAIAQQEKIPMPAPQAPGQMKKMVLPEAPPAEGAGDHVVPGPEPWYTTFATGEVVGYIEPCG